MHIAVIGTGYVGLVTGACFAEFGVEVTCVDVDIEKVEKLNNGIIPIYEPGLDKIVVKNAAAGRLHFTTDIKSAVENAQVVFLAVGTPPQADGTPDMSYYRQAAQDVAESINGYKVLVTKSTVPVGTGKWLRDFVASNLKIETEFGVASNPEFLREGAAIEDFMHPNRVVIGSNEERAIEVMKDLYRPLYLIETPIVITSLEAAELIKYAANAFLATKITFINEVANLCDAIGCDVHDVARGMGMDNRIGRKFLHPGPGYGGSCFPKDTRALTTVADQFGVETRIFQYADLQKIDFENQFDFVLSVDVMEHIEDDIGVFKRFYKALRPGGRVLINTPSNLGGSDADSEDDDSFIEEHVRLGYSKEDISTKLESAGFTVESFNYTYGKWGNRYWRLGIKYPMLMLNKSQLFFIILPFYYSLTIWWTLLFMWLDVNDKNKPEGTGVLVVGKKP